MYLCLAVMALPIAVTQPPKDGKAPLALIDNDVAIDSLDVSPMWNRIAIAGGTQKGGDWKILNLRDGTCLVNGMNTEHRCWGAWAVSLSPDGRFMAVAGSRNLFFVVDANTGDLYWDLTQVAHLGVINNLYFTPDSRQLISVSNDMLIRVWDVKNRKAETVYWFSSINPVLNRWRDVRLKETGARTQEVKGRYRTIARCAVSPDGKVLAVAGDLDGTVLFLELDTGKILKSLQTRLTVAWTPIFSEDGKWLVVGGTPKEGHCIEIWDLQKDIILHCLGDKGVTAAHLALSPNKNTLISGGGGFRVWDVKTGKQRFSYFTKDDPRTPAIEIAPDAPPIKETRSAGVTFLPGGKTFLVAPSWLTRKTQIYFFDAETGQQVDFREAVKHLPKPAPK